MAEPPIDAEFDVDPVVTCPSCGQLNRVRLQSTAGRFRCGRCRTVLVASSQSSGRAGPAGPMLSRARGWVGAAIVVGLVVAYLAMNQDGSWSTPTAEPMRSATPPMAPPRTVLPERRLPQNMVLQETSYPGNGKLAVSNGTQTDAFVKLTHRGSGGPVKAFYVRAGTDFEVDGVPDGEFALEFALGRDWDHEASRFTRDRHFTRFDQPLVYETRQTSTADRVLWRYPVHRVTLHPVPAGNAPTHGISEAEFGGN